VRVGHALALACVLTGCAARKASVPPAAVDRSDYIDLQPGWRLRVVTPALKSGGYELAYYAVRSRIGTGVRVAFLSAEINEEGKTTAQSRPLASLFQLPRSARYVRLIFLTRVSRADHDMAVVASGESHDLDALTRRVLADPADSCKSEGPTYCAWIPRGIAVAPELQRTVDGVGDWVPAR
jgi:hypothetical protein